MLEIRKILISNLISGVFGLFGVRPNLQRDSQNDIMIDIETLSTDKEALIVQIGAIKFNMRTGKLGHRFLANISLKDKSSELFKIDADAVNFWFNQNEETRNSILSNPISLDRALRKFNSFIGSNPNLWCSENFDGVILANSFKKMNIKPNFLYHSFKGIRGIYNIGFKNRKEESEYNKRNTLKMKHNSLVDCEFQIYKLLYCIKKK